MQLVTNSADNLSAEMIERGVARAKSIFERAMSRGVPSETIAGLGAVKAVLNPVADRIAQWMVDTEARAGGPAPKLFKFCAHMDPFVLSYLTLRCALDRAAEDATLMSVASAIGRAVEDEVRLEEFERQNPGLYRVVERTLVERSSSALHARRVWSKNAEGFDIEISRWSQPEAVLVGMALFDLMMEQTKLFDVYSVTTGRNRMAWRVRFLPETAAWLADRTEKAGLLRPAYLPTIEPPKPWDRLRGGGYDYPSLTPLPLVKRAYKQQVYDLNRADLGRVYASVNAVQDTAWEVNRPILDTMQKAWDAGLDLKCFPKKEPLELPPKTWTGEPDEDTIRAWKKSARLVYETNAKSLGARMDLSRLLTVAEDFRDCPALYFPHQLDFRGRLYAVPLGLMPQGPDEARALLTFRDAMPVVDGSSSLDWLLVHGANVFGNDKVSLTERSNWARASLARARATAANPLNDLWWTEADKPWSFLAWCHDIERVMGGDGKSSVPIALDGSCNGLQHYSAMLRDPVGGEAVNLTASSVPQDIYQRVADKAIEELTARSRDGDWVARGWIDFGINRKITKRPVMVLPYGGTRMSCMDYTREAVRERLAGGAENPFGDDLVKAETYLSTIIWDSIGEVVVAARAAMGWLQYVARTCSSHGLPVSWVAPSGFVAHQDYRELSARNIQTRLRGSVVRLKYNEETDKINRSRQALALPPNFVHSLDASALAATVNAARDAGVSSFAVIHDSFGTTATQTDALARIIREAFVSMYETHDPLMDLYHHTLARLPRDAVLDPPPAKGTLDIRGVLDSPYFFA